MKIYADSPQGNSYVIMATVRQLLFDAERRDEWPEIRERMTSGDYANLCAVAYEASYGSIEIVNTQEDEE